MIRALALALILWPASRTALGAVPDRFVDEVKVNFLTAPVGIAFLPGDRLLVIEQGSGRIRLWTGILPMTIATVPELTTGSERGLLGIAVDPRWPAKPFVYVHYTHTGSVIYISRYTASGDLAGTGDGLVSLDPASRYDLLTDIPDRRAAHNGGTLRFGPDGMLYVSLGEDTDPCAAQDTTILGGKILRLDVSRLPEGGGGPPDKTLLAPADNPFVASADPNAGLVWALGLRNPFRFAIDPNDGALYIGDVGEDRYEEVDVAPGGGLDFGWPWREGFEPFQTCVDGATTGFEDPIHVYDHGLGFAVIGGVLYRRNGGANQFPPQYEGDFFFSDYYSGELYRLKRYGATWRIADPVDGQPTPGAWGDSFASVSDYAIGPDGAIWYVDESAGRVKRIRYLPPLSVPSGAPDPASALYDIQGRRVEDPKRSGLFFTKQGKKRVVLR